MGCRKWRARCSPRASSSRRSRTVSGSACGAALAAAALWSRPGGSFRQQVPACEQLISHQCLGARYGSSLQVGNRTVRRVVVVHAARAFRRAFGLPRSTPAQTPCTWLVASANSWHSARTGQPAQMACAALMSVPARSGKNRPGSSSRQAARSRHLLRPGAAAGALRAVTARPPALQLPPTRWPRRPRHRDRTPGRRGSRLRLRGMPGHQARPACRRPPRQTRLHKQSTRPG